MSRSPLRDHLLGMSMDGDRLWLLHTPTGIFAITEYNHELTGYAPELGILDPNIFRYGGNAYFITGLYAQQKGWQVEKFEDRNCEIVQ